MKELTVNEFWNGIKIGDYKMRLIMDKTCMTLEEVGKMTRAEEFRYKELEEKLNNFFNTYDKILLNIPFGQLQKRIKTLTEKLGYSIEKTVSLEEMTANHDRVYAVLTK